MFHQNEKSENGNHCGAGNSLKKPVVNIKQVYIWPIYVNNCCNLFIQLPCVSYVSLG